MGLLLGFQGFGVRVQGLGLFCFFFFFFWGGGGGEGASIDVYISPSFSTQNNLQILLIKGIQTKLCSGPP